MAKLLVVVGVEVAFRIRAMVTTRVVVGLWVGDRIRVVVGLVMELIEGDVVVIPGKKKKGHQKLCWVVGGH